MTDLTNLCSKVASRMLVPFGSTYKGIRYDVATDGHAILLVPGTKYPKRNNAVPISGVLKGSDRAATHRTTLEALREWTAEVPPPDKCSGCNGTGTIPHSCDCQFCHYDDEEECDDCGGTGQWSPIDKCEFGSVSLDRRLLARVVAELDGDGTNGVDVSFGGELDAVRLTVGEVIALVMPLRGDGNFVTSFDGWSA